MNNSAIIVGLMSGTSADGVDACVARLALDAPGTDVAVRGADYVRSTGGLSLSHEIISHRTFPHAPSLRRAILGARTVSDACRLNFAVAAAFAAAALRVISAARLRPSDVLAIASHGQTLFHAPSARPIGAYPSRSTMQVGDGCAIAAATGILTVSDFRAKDVALGGQGAPLVPFVEYLLTPPGGAVWLNIGGISNITVVPQGARDADVVAFDTGPGNTLLDRIIRQRSNGRGAYDAGGRLALKGTVDERLLTRMLAHPYFRRRPPKSTGPEEFGEAFLKKYRLPERIEDACATLAALTAETIARGVKTAAKGKGAPRLIASGGGTKNAAIMRRLSALLAGMEVADSGFIGVPPEAKEAFAFAVLGFCTLSGIPNNLPSATGASRPAVLGKISPPE